MARRSHSESITRVTPAYVPAYLVVLELLEATNEDQSVKASSTPSARGVTRATTSAVRHRSEKGHPGAPSAPVGAARKAPGIGPSPHHSISGKSQTPDCS